ncbi:photosynthetic reaction center subunit H [Rhodovibrio salinarum]|uniref:Photosynthetic reaction center subunit H n=1 Tax=Rhodovibrio salinarum TaxID=1087 RepID=A0A934QGW5_9PROT|nr:photosynthetic reaction center subunit H [Rhodovibrio salinarum]MBK1696335.1 photosynthetic reaction center subunit H [Rhodovibrio salinarum]
MPFGAITEYMDVAQIVLYVFWIFFAGLIIYIRREDKREGYPLESDRIENTNRIVLQGWPSIPKPKRFLLPDGSAYFAPDFKRDERPVPAEPAGNFPGAPLIPTGDPLKDQIGAAAYAERHDTPELTWHGEAKIVPISQAEGWKVIDSDPDPRGMDVYCADGETAGTVKEIWVDKPESIIRYLEVDCGTAQAAKSVLVPFFLTKVKGNARKKWIDVKAVTASQFKDAPTVKDNTQITRLEEDKIMGYFGGGHLHAMPHRAEPLL